MNKRIRKKCLKKRMEKAKEGLRVACQTLTVVNSCPTRKWFNLEAGAVNERR